jgi:hypothetical protein
MLPKFVYSIHTVAEQTKRHLMMRASSQSVETRRVFELFEGQRRLAWRTQLIY